MQILIKGAVLCALLWIRHTEKYHKYFWPRSLDIEVAIAKYVVYFHRNDFMLLCT